MIWYDPGIIEGIGVSLSIILIITLIRKGWQMYWVLLISCLLLALTNGNNFTQNLNLLFNSLISPSAFYLVSMVVMITILSHLHQKIGAMENLVEHLRFLVRDPRALLMIFPAAISLFSTVPGGAIISAPMVEETGRDLKMPPIELAMSNIIYRHMIVLINPFNTSLILASGISGISIASYLSFTVPVIAIVFIIATMFLIYRYPWNKRISSTRSVHNSEQNSRRQAWAGLLSASSPYLLAMFLGLVVGVYFPLALLAGIGIAFLINLPDKDKGAALLSRLVTLLHGFKWPMTLTALTIIFYKDFMLEAESIQQVTRLLIDQGLPLIAIVIALPFFTGFITGNNTASLGIALPIIIPFLGPEMLSVRYFGLIYLSSYAGYFGSPVHLCTYLTNDYFKTPLFSLIKRVNVYSVIMIVVGLTMALLY